MAVVVQNCQGSYYILGAPGKVALVDDIDDFDDPAALDALDVLDVLDVLDTLYLGVLGVLYLEGPVDLDADGFDILDAFDVGEEEEEENFASLEEVACFVALDTYSDVENFVADSFEVFGISLVFDARVLLP